MYAGPGSSSPSYLTGVGAGFFFSAVDDKEGHELWKTGKHGEHEGSQGHMEELPGASPRIEPLQLENMGGTLVFNGRDQQHGLEPWRSDGTASGTRMIANVMPEGEGKVWSSDPRAITRVGDVAYFIASGRNMGRELWVTDGSSGGTRLVEDVLEGPDGSSMNHLTAHKSLLLFTTTDGVHGHESWRSGDDAKSTFMLPTISVPEPSTRGPSSLPRSSAKRSSMRVISVDFDSEVWVTKGTRASTERYANVNVSTLESQFGDFGVLGDTCSLGVLGTTETSAEEGLELYASDGTAEGTGFLKEIVAGIEGSNPHDFVPVGDLIFFKAWESDYPQPLRLWVSDGTSDGTMRLHDLRPIDSSRPWSTSVQGELVFGASDGSSIGLWRSDGTPDGTVPIKDGFDNFPLWFADVNGVSFFAVDDQLWKSNGTTDGTVLVKDLETPEGSNPQGRIQWLTNENGTLMFAARNPSTGMELWRSDGTTGGTELVKDIAPAEQSSSPYLWIHINGTTYFVAEDPTNGIELWKSDGTPEGTE